MDDPIWTSHADLAIKRRSTVGATEFLDHMTFKTNKRPLFTELFGPIIGLKEEWRRQGATPEELDFSAFQYRCEARASVPVVTGRFGGVEPVVIEETAERTVSKDSLGRTMVLLKGAGSIPLPMDYPVKIMDDWSRIKPRYQFSEERFDKNWRSVCVQARAEDKVLVLPAPGGFDEPRQLMGEEGMCVAMLESPELIRDMLETIGDTVARVAEIVSSEITIDMLSVHEDLAGKNGPLIGPKHVETFIKPYYQKIWNPLRANGARLFDVDSDGDVTPVLDAFIGCGVNCMHPMEPAAGVDIVEVRRKHGRDLAFLGGLDKHVLRDGKEAIDAELERKIPPMIQSGGCVLSLDHRVPNGTPLENYRYYVDRVWDMIR